MKEGAAALDLTYLGKLAGFVAALDTIPFVDLAVGIIIFAVASIIKDTVNRIGDLMDHGQVYQSCKG